MHFLLEKGATINGMPERLENSYILFYSILQIIRQVLGFLLSYQIS